jgi:outer membrane protein TolC
MKSISILMGLLVLPQLLLAQTMPALTLEYCYDRLHTDFPIEQKLALQDKITDLQVELSKSGLQPEILVNGSISYQSDVTEVGFAGAAAPEFSKDHYNISLDVQQPLFDGGRTTRLKEVELASGDAAKAGVEVELWNLRNQVNEVFFGITLWQKQQLVVELLLSDLEKQYAVVQSKVEHGVLLPSNRLILKAELLKVQQQKVQVEATLLAWKKVLGELLGEEIDANRKLIVPDSKAFIERDHADKNRPEFEVFEQKNKVLQTQAMTIEADKLPVVSAFAKTAYARPGLNAFDDDLQLYWVIGVKAQWSFKQWRNADRKSQILRIQQDKNKADEDAFSRQLSASLSRLETQIDALQKQLIIDEEVLQLRTEITKEKESQLNQGAITSTEYLTELTAETQARLNLEMHYVQLIQFEYEYLTQRGISWN